MMSIGVGLIALSYIAQNLFGTPWYTPFKAADLLIVIPFVVGAVLILVSLMMFLWSHMP